MMPIALTLFRSMTAMLTAYDHRFTAYFSRQRSRLCRIGAVGRIAIAATVLGLADHGFTADDANSNGEISVPQLPPLPPRTADRSPAERSQQPHIVMLFTDDQRHRAAGFAGNAALQTPHLDRLAQRGTIFRNCFVNTSICAVSRANLLSGQYPARHGVDDFHKTFSPSQLQNTVPGRLRHAGYQTAFFGKWGIGDTPERTHEGAAVFDYWAGQPRQTNYFYESDCRYVNYDGFSRQGNDLCDCPADKRGRVGYEVRIGKDTLTNPQHQDADVIPGHVERFLKARDPSRPFCLMVFFKSPHGPFGDWSPQTQSYTDGRRIQIPQDATQANASREPDVVKRSLGWPAGQNLLSSRQRHERSIRDYYRSISSMDIGVGRIMAALQKHNVADNTVVLFTSDNGHFSGEHGLGGKWLMYEPSLRVPGFVCDLRQAPASTVREELVITTDFSVTMLAVAGVDIPKEMTGGDLTRLYGPPDKTAADWRTDFLYDHPYGHGGKIPTTRGVRSQTHSYTRYTSTSPVLEQLFDLRSDPGQLRNLAGDRQQQQLLQQMRRRCDELATKWGPVPTHSPDAGPPKPASDTQPGQQQ